MAKGRTILPTIASIEVLYHSVEDLPWDEIEAAVGRVFSTEERDEIFRCSDSYASEKCWLQEAPTVRGVDELKKELLSHAKAICALAEVYKPNGSAIDQEAMRVIEALNVIHSVGSYTFRQSFYKAAEASERLVACLEQEPDFTLDSTHKTPEVAGLTAFLTAVLEFADERPARNNHPSSWTAKGKEYRRWGVSIGPRCNGFPEFVSLILKRDVSVEQLRNAWPGT